LRFIRMAEKLAILPFRSPQACASTRSDVSQRQFRTDCGRKVQVAGRPEINATASVLL
jgi:hypothetical protein